MSTAFRSQQSCCRCRRRRLRRNRFHDHDRLVRLRFAHVKQFHLQCIVLRVDRLQVLFQLHEFLLDFVVVSLFGEKFLVQLFDEFSLLMFLVLLLLVVVLQLLDLVGELSLVIELILFALTILLDHGIVVRVQAIELLLHALQARTQRVVVLLRLMVLLRQVSVFHLAVGALLLDLFRRGVLGGEISLERVDLLLELEGKDRCERSERAWMAYRLLVSVHGSDLFALVEDVLHGSRAFFTENGDER